MKANFVLQPLRVLVIHSIIEVRYLLRDTLQPLGHKVECAVNGLMGLAAVRSSAETGAHFELVICDLLIPEMDCPTLTQRIREISQVPIIWLAEQETAGLDKRAADCGANKVVALSQLAVGGAPFMEDVREVMASVQPD